MWLILFLLTPDQVARAAGCKVEHYQRIERGAELPVVMVLVGLHRTLAFSADRALLRRHQRQVHIFDPSL